MDDNASPGAMPVNEPEDGTTVILEIISAVATAAVLLIACSYRMQQQRRKARSKYKKLSKTPGHEDASHTEGLLKKCESPETMVPELLLGIAKAPVLLDTARSKRLPEDGQVRQLRRQLAQTLPEWSHDEMGLDKAARQNLLLIYYNMYHKKLVGVTLSDEQEQMSEDVGALVGQLLLGSFEAACKRQELQQSLTVGRLIACFRLGLWSWDDPQCLQLMRARLGTQGAPYPRITVGATVKSWMDAPALAPSCTIELTVTIQREHAGPSGATPQRVGWRGHESYDIMESYTCLVSREVDGEGGAKGSMLGRLEVEVEDLAQPSATATLKMFAPKQPGEYELRVTCMSLVVIGVATETARPHTPSAAAYRPAHVAHPCPCHACTPVTMSVDV